MFSALTDSVPKCRMRASSGVQDHLVPLAGPIRRNSSWGNNAPLHGVRSRALARSIAPSTRRPVATPVYQVLPF